MDLGIAGRRAVVAASSSGLGLETARALGEAGCEVIVSGRSEDKLAAAAEAVPNSRSIVADLANAAGAEAFIDQAREMLGGIDILVKDEAAATAAAKKLLGFTQGRHADWTAPDPELARAAVPANRKRVYDMHAVIDAIVDVDSALELRPDWTPGLITAFARMEGRPMGLIANNPLHLAGAVDHGAATKAGEFMQLCERWGIPILFLCDTPGFMVGPDSDAEGLPRSAGALFRIGGNLTVPFGLIVTRKAYGLGAQAMAGGGLKEPLFSVSWPTGEFGPMGLEGAVRLGFARELAEAGDPAAQEALFEQLVDTMYQHGKATNVASHFEIDDVIDPADTRRWVTRLLR